MILISSFLLAGCNYQDCTRSNPAPDAGSPSNPLLRTVPDRRIDEPARPLMVVCAGDSTVATYRDPNPGRGWGQFLNVFFESNVTVRNLAAGGRSSRSFIGTGKWRQTLDLRPDYVFVQFGHNDKKPEPERKTDPQTSYKEYLRRYIDEGAAAGARIILVTSMERRLFGEDGRIMPSYGDYAQAMREVAAEKDVLLIDLHAYSIELFERMGKEATDAIANNPEDDTHWNEKGARIWAEFITTELRRGDSRYAPLIGSLKQDRM